MAETEETTNIEQLKTKIKRLNSKAGQMKMDLHDLAEGLPTDYENLMDVAEATYKIYSQLNELKQQVKNMEKKYGFRQTSFLSRSRMSGMR